MNSLLNFKTEEFEFRVPSYTPLELEMIKDFENDKLINDYLSDYKEYIEETINGLKNSDDLFRYTSIVYKDNVPIGLISLFDIQNEMIFSCGILTEHRGKGYANRIREGVCEYVFYNFPRVECITGYIDATNTNSLKSISKSSEYEINKMFDKTTGKEYFKIMIYNLNYLKDHPRS